MTEQHSNQETPETPEQSQSRRNWLIAGGILLVAIVVLVLAFSGVFSPGEADTTPEATAPAVGERFIEILQPAPGAVLEVNEPVTISGNAGGLFEGNVIVEIRDEAGDMLAVQPTTIQAEDAGTGGSGPWEVQLQVAAEPGTPAVVIAYSTSAEDGSVVTEARVPVTLGTPAPGAPFVFIQSPVQGAVVDISQPFEVVGTGGALFEGNVVVEARDLQGAVLAQQPTIIRSPEAGTGGQGPWAVQLSVQVAPGTPGEIVAYATSPQDGSIVAEDQVGVTLGVAEEVPVFITITEPESGTALDTTAPIAIRGTGSGLPEGNVVVQARDQAGTVIAQDTTSLQSSAGEVTEPGSWALSLVVPVEADTPGLITAFSTSPAGGETVAETSVEVNFFIPEAPAEEAVVVEEHLWLLQQLNGSPVLENTPVTAEFIEGRVAGNAGCNNYSATYERTFERITFDAPAATRQACSEPAGIMEQENAFLTALTEAATFVIDGGQLQIRNATGETSMVFAAAVTGRLVSEGAELPAEAVIIVQLQDVSVADAPAQVLGEQRPANTGIFPVAFAVTYDPELIEQSRTYAIRGWVETPDGTLLLTNTEQFRVITQGAPQSVDVRVEAVE
jgi:putative lipoprotein